MDDQKTKDMVREHYAKVAREKTSCCGPVGCGGATAESRSERVGYTEEDMKAIPEEANLGVGCGNPVAIASLQEGERVLDLGSGAGIDCFLAAARVGKTGKVIGVDMTDEMLDLANRNLEKSDYENVEFRKGEIENLPLDDSSVDVVISNCVINLVPDKAKVFSEIARVLAPGGRVMVSDIVAVREIPELPEVVLKSAAAYTGCLTGAILVDNYLAKMEEAGLAKAQVQSRAEIPVEFITDDPAAQAVIDEHSISLDLVKELVSCYAGAKISAVKPG